MADLSTLSTFLSRAKFALVGLVKKTDALDRRAIGFLAATRHELLRIFTFRESLMAFSQYRRE